MAYALQMSHSEVVGNIQKAFKQRVAPATHVPMDLTTEEAAELLDVAPINIVLHAFRKHANWLNNKMQQGTTINRDNTWKSLLAILDKAKKDDAQSKAAYLAKHPRKQNPTPVRVVEKRPDNAEQVLGIRQEFQDRCTLDDWTITEMESADLLKRHDVETLHRVFADLGKYPADKAADCLDLLEWKLSTC